MESIRGSHVSMHFDSIIELMDVDVTNHYSAKRWISIQHQVEGKLGPTNNKPQDAFDHALLGDHELYENHLKNKIEELDKSTHAYNSDYVQVVPVVRRKRIKKSFGDELDIHAVNQGRLDKAWSTTQRVEFDNEHHLVTLFVDIGGTWDTYAPHALWVTAACVKIVNDLEIAGKSVQIIVGAFTMYTTVNREHMTLSAVAKRYNERLSLERLAAMTHLGFYRVAGFKGKLACSKELVTGLGSPTRITPDFYPHYLQDELKMGHTKVIVLDKATNLYQSIACLNSAYSQLKSIKEGVK